MWNTNPMRRRNVKRSLWSSDMLHMLDTMDASNRRLQRHNTDSDAMSPDDVSTGMVDPQVPLHSRSSSIPRCLAVHPSATELAVGDKEGNMKVYNLETMELCSSHSAHNAEILTMHYSPPIMVGDPDEGEQSSRVLLATAGRDRLVHTFDASDQYRHMLTLDNHSASVTAVRFTGDGRRLLTCGGDKTMTLNRVTPNEVGSGLFAILSAAHR
jgi:WD40 repeat protein